MTITEQVTGELSTLSGQLDLGWRYNPLEHRNEHGQWTRGGGDISLPAGEQDGGGEYQAPDHARLINPRGHPPDPADHPFFKAHPVSAANVMAVYDRTPAGFRQQGMRWYADAHTIATALAGGDADKGAGVLAAYSPQTSWPVNMMNAARALELGRAIGPGEGMITGSMQGNAQEAIDGMAADEANSSSKTKAFARLIRNGGDMPDDRLGDVVIDRHAMSVAMGKVLPKAVADKVPLSHENAYQYVADQYRAAAKAISERDGVQIAPHQLQAITWLQQQAENEAIDTAGVGDARGGAGAMKGRASAQRKAWARWGEQVAQHHIPVHKGTTSLAGTISGQLDLAGGWRDAWLHELRGPHGEWLAGGAGEALKAAAKPPDYSHALAMLALARSHPDAYPVYTQMLDEAMASLDAGDPDSARKKLRLLADFAVRHPSGMGSGSKTDALFFRNMAAEVTRQAAKAGPRKARPVPGAPPPPEITAVKNFLDQHAAAVPGMFGPGLALAWDRQAPTEYRQRDKPSYLAQMDWQGHMSISDEAATRLQDTLTGDGPINDPDALTVPLHEMVHAVEPAEDITDLAAREANQRAYQDPAVQAVEEGFTQLGTAQHAGEFFEAAGVAGRQTPFTTGEENPDRAAKVAELRKTVSAVQRKLADPALPHGTQQALQIATRLSLVRNDITISEDPDQAMEDLQPLLHSGWPEFAQDGQNLAKLVSDYKQMSVSSHYTMAQYAQQMADPAVIRRGASWPHYAAWTGDAQKFADTIAELGGKPGDPDEARRVSDAVNGVGAAKKMRVMAELTMVASGADRMIPPLTAVERDRALIIAEQSIREQWQKAGPDGAVTAAAKAFKTSIANMRMMEAGMTG